MTIIPFPYDSTRKTIIRHSGSRDMQPLEGSFSKNNFKNYKIRFLVSGEWAPKVELVQNNELPFY